MTGCGLLKARSSRSLPGMEMLSTGYTNSLAVEHAPGVRRGRDPRPPRRDDGPARASRDRDLQHPRAAVQFAPGHRARCSAEDLKVKTLAGQRLTAPVGLDGSAGGDRAGPASGQPARPYPRVRRLGASIGRTTAINVGSEYGEGVLRGVLLTVGDGRLLGYQADDSGDQGRTTGHRSSTRSRSERHRQLSRTCRSRACSYFFGAYVDVHGVPKSKCVPIAHLDDAARGIRALHRRRAGRDGRARPERGRVRGHPGPGRA